MSSDKRKFHPAFEKATATHRARTERDVKLEAEKKADLAAPFWVGLPLTVISKGRHTIVVEFFDGREMVTRRLEVLDV